MEEQELIQDCIAARPKAQKALFDIYAPKLYVVCLRYMKDQMRAQDVLQDAFVKIFAHIGNYKSEGAFEGWLTKNLQSTPALTNSAKTKNCSQMSLLDDVSHKLAHRRLQRRKTHGRRPAQIGSGAARRLPHTSSTFLPSKAIHTKRSPCNSVL